VAATFRRFAAERGTLRSAWADVVDSALCASGRTRRPPLHVRLSHSNVAKDATLEWGTLILLLLNTKQNMFPHSRFNVRDVMTFIS
jgi:hypothetical protein